MVKNLWVPKKVGNFLGSRATISFLRMNPFHRSIEKTKVLIKIAPLQNTDQ
jgi:hypothetical protein